MPDPILDLPLEAIAEDALARDRAALDPDAQHELANSIVTSGLRMPIEVYVRPNPEGERLYGLISGYRRLMAFRELHAHARDKTLWPTIPAFIRTNRDSLPAPIHTNAAINSSMKLSLPSNHGITFRPNTSRTNASAIALPRISAMRVALS